MKINHLIQILIGGFVPFHMWAQPVPVPDVLGSASSFTVIAVEGDGDYQTNSDLDDFSASGSCYSQLDGSAASAAQWINYLFGTEFNGAGRLRVVAGNYLGEPSTSAVGTTSVYILFKITNSFHYQFESTVTTTQDILGHVTFDGIDNSNGTMLANGTISSNLYALHALMAQGNGSGDGEGTWSYSLSLTPANTPARLSAAQKSDLYAQLSASRTLSNLLAAQANNEAPAERLEFLQASVVILALANDLDQDFLDPLDTNYTVISQAAPLPVTPLAAGNGITQLEADDYNAWLTNLSLTAGYDAALTSSLNRAQGAAFAGNSFWDTAQMNAAAQFEAQLAALFDQEPALRSNVVAQFESDGFQGAMVTTNDAIALQTQISTNGLPAGLLDALTGLGADSQTITNIQNNLLTADAGTLAGSFPESLVNTNLDLAAQTLASGLRNASLRLMNASLLPGGQLRFDLPTEPGYAYTIQFAQNLGNPAGWTTLFTNHATTPLTSFTNTLPPNAPAGFYRASHN
ncbi:MAG TPA: hypothetical protein VG146_04425 [Verrucomicrobiae bacterium]|nr:hypothetical protein [Verrucomicrobiae bacterium]